MEWTVVSVLVVIIGLVGAFVKPLIKWNTNLVENTMAIRGLTDTMKKNESDNKQEHCEIWDELDKHDERITKIEQRD